MFVPHAGAGGAGDGGRKGGAAGEGEEGWSSRRKGCLRWGTKEDGLRVDEGEDEDESWKISQYE